MIINKLNIQSYCSVMFFILRFVNQYVEPTTFWKLEMEPSSCSNQADGTTNRVQELLSEQQVLQVGV